MASQALTKFHCLERYLSKKENTIRLAKRKIILGKSAMVDPLLH